MYIYICVSIYEYISGKISKHKLIGAHKPTQKNTCKRDTNNDKKYTETQSYTETYTKASTKSNINTFMKKAQRQEAHSQTNRQTHINTPAHTHTNTPSHTHTVTHTNTRTKTHTNIDAQKHRPSVMVTSISVNVFILGTSRRVTLSKPSWAVER